MKKLIIIALFALCCAAQPEYDYTFTAPAGADTCYTNVIGCGGFGNFVSTDGLYTAAYQVGQTIQWLRINGAASQAVETTNLVWSGPTDPATGQPIADLQPGQVAVFTANADIALVCTVICQNASGQLVLTGQWSYQWVTVRLGGGCKASCFVTKKKFVNVTDLTITGQSTVAIID